MHQTFSSKWYLLFNEFFLSKFYNLMKSNFTFALLIKKVSPKHSNFMCPIHLKIQHGGTSNFSFVERINGF